MQTQLDKLGPTLEVRLEPGQRCYCNAELRLQPFEKYAWSTVVQNGVILVQAKPGPPGKIAAETERYNIQNSTQQNHGH